MDDRLLHFCRYGNADAAMMSQGPQAIAYTLASGPCQPERFAGEIPTGFRPFAGSASASAAWSWGPAKRTRGE